MVDFLILVGGLEESSGSKGDSAEVALTVCGDDDTKVTHTHTHTHTHTMCMSIYIRIKFFNWNSL